MTRQGRERVKRGAREEKSLRCLCGSLLARLVADGVELKCRRCKRQVIVPLEENTTGKAQSSICEA